MLLGRCIFQVVIKTQAFIGLTTDLLVKTGWNHLFWTTGIMSIVRGSGLGGLTEDAGIMQGQRDSKGKIAFFL